MTITPVSSLSATTAAAAAAASGTASTSSLSNSINFNFTTYLQILTTQLKNQDPTNATDPNQYTQELINIEQAQIQNNTNNDLEGLTSATTANGLATGVSYIGNYVSANSSSGEFPLQNGASEFGYTLAGNAGSAIVTVQDANGNAVDQFNGGTASGANYVTWNGQDAGGNQLPDGTYSFTVAASDGNGNVIAATNPVAFFKVTSVQSNTNGTLQLLAGSLSLSTADITDVYTAQTLPRPISSAQT